MDRLGKTGFSAQALWMPTDEEAKEGNCQESRGGDKLWGGPALVAGLHMHRRKGNGICSKSFSPTCLLWKPREVRVRCPAQKQICATHSHTPSIQPNNFILQTHNPLPFGQLSANSHGLRDLPRQVPQQSRGRGTWACLGNWVLR